MRAWDCVIIAAESDLDLLEARFAEYADLDVVHVIAECVADYKGSRKPLWFWENREDRFASFHGKWNHVRVEAHELPSAAATTRKNALRDYLAHAVAADPDDIILHGNADEIPRAGIVQEIMAGNTLLPIGTEMRWCAYDPRRVHPHPWRGTVAQHWKNTGSFAGMRDRKNDLPALVNAGTRLSLMNDILPEDGMHPDGTMLREEEIDETWPKWVRMKFPC